MNETTLASLAGVVLSLAFSYIPGLRDKYATLSPDYKRLVMLGALLLVSIGMFAAGCMGYTANVTCDMAGAQILLGFFITAAVANQGTYMLTPNATVKG